MKYYIFHQEGDVYRAEEKEFSCLGELFRYCYYMGRGVLVVDESGAEDSVLKKIRKYLFFCMMYGKKDVISRIAECIAHNLGLEKDLRKIVHGIFASISRMTGRAVAVFVVYIDPDGRYYVWRYKYSLKTGKLTIYRVGRPIDLQVDRSQKIQELTNYPRHI